MALTDEQDRRHFLKCMAWVGTGAVWTLTGGVLKGSPLAQAARIPVMSHADGALRFVQISDSHIGFDKPANTDVIATLRATVEKIKAAPEPPAFVLHTGDLTHLSKPAEFELGPAGLQGPQAMGYRTCLLRTRTSVPLS
jgi:2',3'-cyclic-nucleotide 2'-phosphodiesterase (5'-nucleotidase family)